MQCQKCAGAVRKFGKDRRGQQRFRCDDCRITFIEPSEKPLGVMRLPMDDAVKCVQLVLEGMSIRSTERITGISRNTIMALLLLVGERCKRMLDNMLVNVCVDDIQADEIWSYVGCHEKVRAAKDYGSDRGDAYCFVAIERTTKLIVAWHLGKRTTESTTHFSRKLAQATSGRFQLSTDGFAPYRSEIPAALGGRVDHMLVVKTYGTTGVEDQRRYSPPGVTGIQYEVCCGKPKLERACTSHIERSNLSLRMSVRRMARLTNAYSKKWESHKAAIALYTAFYNLCRVHMSLRGETPAMATGLADHVWTIRELIEESAKA